MNRVQHLQAVLFVILAVLQMQSNKSNTSVLQQRFVQHTILDYIRRTKHSKTRRPLSLVILNSEKGRSLRSLAPTFQRPSPPVRLPRVGRRLQVGVRLALANVQPISGFVLIVEESETRGPAVSFLRDLFGLQDGLDYWSVEGHSRAQDWEEDDVVGQGPEVVDLAHLLVGFFSRLDARLVRRVADDAKDEDVPWPEGPKAEGEDPDEDADEDQFQETFPGPRLPTQVLEGVDYGDESGRWIKIKMKMKIHDL